VKSSLFFFDVDHTITRGSTGRRFAEAATRRGLIKLRYLSMIPVSYLQYRLGSGTLALFERDFPMLKGVERSFFEEIGREAFDRSVYKTVRPEITRLIAEIRAGGGSIVLATSSLDFIVEPLARLLEIDEVLASELEFANGRCTGRIAGKPLFGADKRDAVCEYARGRGVAMSDCAFYSDSIRDLPLLLAVGEPVAVAPDRRLRKEALTRGWPILELR
jgi:HAD superfamily hydrolase (TIGR01490 family)